MWNNYNILSYLLYLPIIVFITVKVGKVLYNAGLVYVRALFPHDKDFCLTANLILLRCYYLVNIGYSVLIISVWPSITSPAELISTTANNLGMVIIILAGLHYFNMIAFNLIKKYNLINN